MHTAQALCAPLLTTPPASPSLLVTLTHSPSPIPPGWCTIQQLAEQFSVTASSVTKPLLLAQPQCLVSARAKSSNHSPRQTYRSRHSHLHRLHLYNNPPSPRLHQPLHLSLLSHPHQLANCQTHQSPFSTPPQYQYPSQLLILNRHHHNHHNLAPQSPPQLPQIAQPPGINLL
jgi:hypothetical protein